MTNKLKNPMTAQNREQKQLVKSIIENPVTIVTGVAGSGKTFVTMGLALQKLVHEECQKLILSRPLICTGRALPALPGTLDEKMDPYWYQMQEYLNYFLGEERAHRFRHEKRVIFQPLEVMRGMNFHKEYVIVTEAQNATYNQIKMLLTRIGDEDSRVIIDGDIEQTDLRLENDWQCPLEQIASKLEQVEEIGQVNLIQSLRHPLVDKVARLL